jgi:hypothetical protein
MNKLLASGAVVASFAGAQTANAQPELSLFVAAPLMGLSNCTAIGGSYSGVGLGGDCFLVTNSLTGTAVDSFSYGGWGFTVGIGEAAPVKNEPDLWLGVTGAPAGAGAADDPLSVGDIVTGYNFPGSPFNVLTRPSGTLEGGVTSDANLYFDPTNSTNPAVNGALVYTTGDWVGYANSPAGASPIGPLAYGGDDYSLEWIQTIACTNGNCSTAEGEQSMVGTNLELISTGVPAPTPLAILGLGLLAMGGFATKRRFDIRS